MRRSEIDYTTKDMKSGGHQPKAHRNLNKFRERYRSLFGIPPIQSTRHKQDPTLTEEEVNNIRHESKVIDRSSARRSGLIFLVALVVVAVPISITTYSIIMTQNSKKLKQFLATVEVHSKNHQRRHIRYTEALNAARAAHQAQNWSKVMRYYEMALVIYPEDSIALTEYALHMAERCEYDGSTCTSAVFWYKKLKKRWPDHPVAFELEVIFDRNGITPSFYLVAPRNLLNEVLRKT